MKNFIAVIMIVAITVMGMSMLYETGIIGKGQEHVANAMTDTAYAMSAGTSYRKFISYADEQAQAEAYTGVMSETCRIGADEIEFDAFYINGTRVSAIEYNSYTDGLISELEAQNEELGTFSGFVSHKLGLDK